MQVGCPPEWCSWVFSFQFFIRPLYQYNYIFQLFHRVDDESFHNVSSSTVRKASSLVKELSSLREEMQGLVSVSTVLIKSQAVDGCAGGIRQIDPLLSV